MLGFAGACEPHTLASNAPRVTTTASTVAPNGSAAFTCPPYDRAALEAEERAREEKGPLPKDTLTLGEVILTEEARDKSPAKVELQEIGAVHLQHGKRKHDRMAGYGLGFVGMSVKWFTGKVAPDVETSLVAWEKQGTARMDAAGLSNLLTKRALLLRAFPSPGGEALIACAEADRAAAEAAFAAEDAAWTRAEVELGAKVEALTTKNAHERLLGAYVAKNSLRYDDVQGRAKPLAELRALTTDAQLSTAEQVWVWQGIAQLTNDVADFDRAAALSDDVAFRLTMLEDALGLAPAAEREKRLRELIALVEQSGVERWRLSGAYKDLAELRLVNEDLAGAREASVRCVAAVDPREPDNIYRTLCSEYLADAMIELGAPENVTVPAITLGPLAIALMDRALEHYDRDTARRVGELLLERSPMAIEAPGVLERLRVIAEEPRRSALADRATRDYGTPSPWLEAQRRRLAPETSSPEELDRKLTALRPSDVKGSPPPTNAEELEDELRARAFDAAQYCADDFRSTKLRKVDVTVDTTGPRPKVKVAPASHKPLTRCLERQGALFFRSLGPRRIRFEVSEYPRPKRPR